MWIKCRDGVLLNARDGAIEYKEFRVPMTDGTVRSEHHLCFTPHNGNPQVIEANVTQAQAHALIDAIVDALNADASLVDLGAAVNVD